MGILGAQLEEKELSNKRKICFLPNCQFDSFGIENGTMPLKAKCYEARAL